MDQVLSVDDLILDDSDLGFDAVLPGNTKQGFLKIAQSSSAEAKRGDPAYIKGLELGQFYCPQRRRIYGDSFLAVAIKFWPSYAVFDGEGISAHFKGNMTVAEFDEKVRPRCHRKKSYMLDERGYRYVDSRNFLVIPYDRPLETPLLFTCTSTAIDASRTWLTIAENLTVPVKDANGEEAERPLPLRASVWKLTTTYTKGDEGDFYKLNAPEYIGRIDPNIKIGEITMRERIKQLYIASKQIDVLMLSDNSEDQSAPKIEAPAAIANVKNVMAGKDAAKDALDVF